MEETLKLLDEAPGLSVHGHKIDLGDVVRYADVISRVIALVESARNIAPGGVVQLGHLKFERGDADFDWDMGSLKRGT